MANVLWIQRLMANIQPWVYPNHPFCVDRVTYTPTRSAHILEYQEEMIDAEGNVYWKTVESTTLSGATSVKEFLEQIKDFYESKSLERIKYSFDNPEHYE